MDFNIFVIPSEITLTKGVCNFLLAYVDIANYTEEENLEVNKEMNEHSPVYKDNLNYIETGLLKIV